MGALFKGTREAAEGFVARRRAVTGAALFRIGFGISGVAYYIANYADRFYFWGPDGVFPFDVFVAELRWPVKSVYAVSESGLWFELLFHFGLAVAVLYLIGFGSRVTAVAHYVLLFSLFQRNPLLLDGGDNLAYLVLLYTIPVQTTAAMSVDAWRRRRRAHRFGTPEPDPRVGSQAGNLLHNAGLAFVVAQVVMLYVAAGMYKVQGQFWQDGTALYYILRVPEFTWPGVSELLYTNATLVTLLTYSVVLFQILFPALVFRRETRTPTIYAAWTFNIGIAYFMNLWSFSIYMMAAEAVFLNDAHYAGVAGRVRRFLGRKPRPEHHELKVPAHVGSEARAAGSPKEGTRKRAS